MNNDIVPGGGSRGTEGARGGGKQGDGEKRKRFKKDRQGLRTRNATGMVSRPRHEGGEESGGSNRKEKREGGKGWYARERNE